MPTAADAFRQLLAVFDRLGVPYLVGGSLASSIHGIARASMDVDILADIPVEHSRELAAALMADFYADPKMIQSALKAGRPFNVIHYASSYKFDIFPVRTAFHRCEIDRRVMAVTSFLGGDAIDFPVATAEDTILAKLEWYRAGGETSERQWNDLRGIIATQGERLDAGYLREWAAKLGLDRVLNHLLES